MIGGSNLDQIMLKIRNCTILHTQLGMLTQGEKMIKCPYCGGTGELSKDNIVYGCHVDLCYSGDIPDPDCVIDLNRRQDCLLASRYVTKEECPEWRPILTEKYYEKD